MLPRVVLVNARRAGKTERTDAARAGPRERFARCPAWRLPAYRSGRPPISSGAYEAFAVVGADPPESSEGTANLVTPEWFAALGMRTISGRLITAQDVAGAPRVAVVNEAFASTFVGGRKPDRPARSRRSRMPIDIVGVVGDVVSGCARRSRRRRPSTCRSRKPTAGSATCMTFSMRIEGCS